MVRKSNPAWWRRFGPLRRRVTRVSAQQLRRTTGLLMAFVGMGLGLLLWLPMPERLAEPPSTFVTYRDGSPAYVFLSPDDKYRMQIDPKEVDPDYLEALLRFEDKRFYYHPGVDPIAIVRSAFLNLRHGKVLSGASTLTMQLVRLLEPRPRTFTSKVVEALRAVQLELHLSKNEILTAYLAFTPFGGNVEGIEAASHAYFGHGAGQLSAEEIAVLLAIPQRPAVRSPSAANAQRLRRARDEIALWLHAEGLTLDGGTTEGLAEVLRTTKVPRRRLPMPREAPHFAFWAREEVPGRTRIETTLDRNLQRLAEGTVAADRTRYANLGIDNVAAVLLESSTGELAAVVGGFDYWSATPGSQIPAFDKPRSPGSALKPLIYAMAIDRGIALPERVVADIPVHYSGYAPGNYDGTFEGLVSLEAALSRSLNIPFVRLLSQVGVENFLDSLRRSGFQHLDPRPGHYGLSAAIGAIEVTPMEMVGLYATLANGGISPGVRWLLDREVSPLQSVLSPGATYLTNRALSRRDRPDFPERRRYRGVSSRVHWKTGTSYGHRDAWAAGFADRYSAAVWLGNLDNRSSADLVGADAAGPLLFDLLEASEPNRLTATERPSPPDLQWLETCAETGYLPRAACPRTAETLALRRSVPTTPCPYHRLIDVDRDTGLALAPGCRSGRNWETRSVVVWPASLRRWLSARHRTLPQMPTLDPACHSPLQQTTPQILSPPAGQTLVLLPGLARDRQELPLQAEVQGPPRQLSWFMDGDYLGASYSDETLWWPPEPGTHRLVVVDADGGSAARQFQVKLRL